MHKVANAESRKSTAWTTGGTGSIDKHIAPITQSIGRRSIIVRGIGLGNGECAGEHSRGAKCGQKGLNELS